MRNPQHKNDFLATKYVTLENPYDTVKYLLRGRKMIKLPVRMFQHFCEKTDPYLLLFNSYQPDGSSFSLLTRLVL